SPPARMVLRHLARQPRRTLLTVLAVSTAMTLIVSLSALFDATDAIITRQFQLEQRQDLAVSFVVAQPLTHRHDLARIPGVRSVQGVRLVPVRLTGPRGRRTVLLEGRDPTDALRRLLDAEGRVVPIPADGMLLTAWIAERLGVVPGDSVMVEVLEGRRRTRTMIVAGLSHEAIGGGATMLLEQMSTVLGETPTMSVAYLTVEPTARERVSATLHAASTVASVNDRSDFVRQLREDMSGRVLRVLLFLQILSAVVAVGVVYNSARIALAERLRELASLRVLGFTRRAVASLFFGELGVQVLLALPVGALLGYLLAGALARAMSTESYRIPVDASAQTVMVGASVIGVAAVVSAALVWRRLDRLSLVAVLKAPE
ncbi:MAG: FtsX-like permease family protein, partial [Gemmatimonadaceae bacterium]|nr:FtsX-like permease family protein [Gemmatimonadaceae bacterium]